MGAPRNAVLALALAASMLVPAAGALADGDPASDVLIGEDVFYPFSPAVSAGLQQTLNAEAARAARGGFPIKVALIHSAVDLGAIPTLFGKPQQYAQFLDQEISFTAVKQLLLVVMPAGYGVRGLSPAATSAAASLPAPGATPDDLARAAIVAVRTLAAAAGHPIGSVSGAGGARSGSGASILPVAVLAVLAVAIAGAILAFRSRRARGRRGRRAGRLRNSPAPRRAPPRRAPRRASRRARRAPWRPHR